MDPRMSKEEIRNRIDSLSDKEAAEVVDFIEFIREKRKKERDFLGLLKEVPGPRIGLQAVRDRLSKIRGSMSESIREQRDERG